MNSSDNWWQLTKVDLTLATSPNRGVDKRNWNQLHGGWGKRSGDNHNDGDDDDDDDDDDDYVPDVQSNRELWDRGQSPWSKRMLSGGVPFYDDQFNYGPTDLTGKRSWNQLHGGWGKRQPLQVGYAPKNLIFSFEMIESGQQLIW